MTDKKKMSSIFPHFFYEFYTNSLILSSKTTISLSISAIYTLQ